MEKQVRESLDQLLETIRNSDTYKEYQRTLKLMEQQPEFFEEANAYRKRVYIVQNSTGVISSMDEMNELRAERNRLDVMGAAGEYLDAEIRYCKMMQGIGRRLLEAADLKIDGFLEDIRI